MIAPSPADFSERTTIVIPEIAETRPTNAEESLHARLAEVDGSVRRRSGSWERDQSVTRLPRSLNEHTPRPTCAGSGLSAIVPWDSSENAPQRVSQLRTARQVLAGRQSWHSAPCLSLAFRSRSLVMPALRYSHPLRASNSRKSAKCVQSIRNRFLRRLRVRHRRAPLIVHRSPTQHGAKALVHSPQSRQPGVVATRTVSSATGESAIASIFRAEISDAVLDDRVSRVERADR